MKLSDIDKYNGQIFGLAKFTSRIDSFLKGDVYMNTLKEYINLERKTGVKGQGDKLEASHVYSDVHFKMYKSGTDELVLSGEAEQLIFRRKIDEETPVYCMFAIHGENLKIVDEDSEYYHTEFSLSNDEIEKIIKDFGEDLVLVNPKYFMQRLESKLKELKYRFRANFVKYDDYGFNYTNRLSIYKQNNHDVFFLKDKTFKHQYEYRIVLTNKVSQEPVLINIGDISEYCHVFKAREFFNDLSISIKK